jgi:glucose-1-phosphate thymidylyltransferase
MKALVLARGLARRMREPSTDDRGLTAAQARAAAAGRKAMMPVGPAGRPFLDYVLGSLADAGCGDVGILVAPEHDEIRRRYTIETIPTRIRAAFVVQTEPRGTADAVLSARAWAGTDPFLVVNGDNLYPVDVLRALAALHEPGLAVCRPAELSRDSNIPPERIAAFALIDVHEAGYLTRIVEKPGADRIAAAGARALVSMNCWRFDTRIFDACRDVPMSPRGELELPVAVGLAVERGVRFATVPGDGAVLDLSRRSDVAEVARRLAGIEPRL